MLQYAGDAHQAACSIAGWRVGSVGSVDQRGAGARKLTAVCCRCRARRRGGRWTALRRQQQSCPIGFCQRLAATYLDNSMLLHPPVVGCYSPDTSFASCEVCMWIRKAPLCIWGAYACSAVGNLDMVQMSTTMCHMMGPIHHISSCCNSCLEAAAINY